MKTSGFESLRNLIVIGILYQASIVACISLVQTDEVEPPPYYGREYEQALLECYETFVGHENTFLRGVKEENFITYNRSTFESCRRHCCSETKFNCSSFSYFAPLGICYVMSLTKYDNDVSLQRFPGWTHYHKEFLLEILFNDTDGLIGNSPINLTTPEPSKPLLPLFIPVASNKNSGSNKSVSTNAITSTSSSQKEDLSAEGSTTASEDLRDNSDVLAVTKPIVAEKFETTFDHLNGKLDTAEKDPEHMRLAGNVQLDCSGLCQNNGICRGPETSLTQDDTNQEDLICECKEGFSGKYCETDDSSASAKAGLPTHIVVIAVIGFIVLILFTTFLVILILYRHKSGKYRLKLRREKWLKKNKKNQPKRSNSFISDMPQPPFDEKIPSPSLFDTLGSRSAKSSV